MNMLLKLSSALNGAEDVNANPAAILQHKSRAHLPKRQRERRLDRRSAPTQ